MRGGGANGVGLRTSYALMLGSPWMGFTINAQAHTIVLFCFINLNCYILLNYAHIYSGYRQNPETRCYFCFFRGVLPFTSSFSCIMLFRRSDIFLV